MLAVCLWFLALDAEPPPKGSLAERLAPLLKAHKGQAAVGVKNLQTGETYYSNPDVVMPAANLIAIPLMIEAYQQANAGKLKLTETLTLREEDKIPGNGVLSRHFSAGATFPLHDAIRLMVAAGDNTAANLVLDRVGIAAVNQRMKDWGFPETRIHCKICREDTTSIDPDRTRRYGFGSTTAREMIGLLEELQLSTRNRPAVKQAILNHLRQNVDRDKFPRDLPEGVFVLHTEGGSNDVRTDAGYLHTPDGVVAICVLTRGNEDRRDQRDNAGNLLCARVARAVYDHHAATKKDKQP
jgi:beta-lactamase class A